MNKALFIFGTRPEAIKMAPLIIRARRDNFCRVKVCVTAQHREMLDQVLDFFGIEADFDLNLMGPNQSLSDITSKALMALEKVLSEETPDLIFVQGDTTTAFVGALAGYYKKIQVAHIEAGLRSGNKLAPFPEEINRTLIGQLAKYHFAPTVKAKENLSNEGIAEKVWIVGNTAIDVLYLCMDIITKQGDQKYQKHFEFIDFSKKIILVTGHRRESFGKPFENICYALKTLGNANGDCEIVYPVHLNPNVRKAVNRILRDMNNVHLIEPLGYPYLVWLMNRAYLICTDSGGIQEEAPSLGKPVLVMRDTTERPEGIEAGVAKLVGTQKETIVREATILLTSREEYEKMAQTINPYGDGKTAGRILNILEREIF
jgi:UDP-N-acetylglucosamine 2-epimerase (non-hydrolysing)